MFALLFLKKSNKKNKNSVQNLTLNHQFYNMEALHVDEWGLRFKKLKHPLAILNILKFI